MYSPAPPSGGGAAQSLRITAAWNSTGRVSTEVETVGGPTAERVLRALATIQDASQRAAQSIIDGVRRDLGDAAADALLAAWRESCETCRTQRPLPPARGPHERTP